MINAASFGTTRYFTGSSPITRSASISPFAVIDANSPAIAAALRATTRIATTIGPISRATNQARARALTTSAPYGASW
jgi:hypothetical protein